MEQFGVIGLGRMGSAIAQRLAAQKLPVQGWTRSGRNVDGITTTSDLATLVAASDTLILSLLDDVAVSATLDALLDLDLDGKQIIETSTASPDNLTSRIEQITAKGATLVDAPISGGPELVLAGKCGVFIGGDDDAAIRAQASLAPITERIFHVGPLGAGLVMKVINNGMLQAYFAGLADLLPLAQRAGLPLETAMRILCGGPAGMPMVTDRLPKILGEDTSVGFAMSGVFKDNLVFRKVLENYDLTSPILESFDALKDQAAAADILDRDPAELVNMIYDGAKTPT